MFIGLVDISLCSLIEEWIKNVVGVIGSFSNYFFSTYICTMISGSGYNDCFSSECLNHRNLFRTCSFRHINFAFDANSCAISSNGHTGISAGILNAFFDADFFHMSHQRCCASIFKRKSRHHVIHLDHDILVK